MKTLSLTLLLILCFGISTQARIGESLDECIKRYGDPVQRDTTKTLFFHKSGIAITCSFIETLCVQISYKKLDASARLNEREVEILRTANGSKWQIMSSDSLHSYIRWRNEVCDCQWDRQSGLLQFETLAEKQRQGAAMRAEEKKRLDGF